MSVEKDSRFFDQTISPQVWSELLALFPLTSSEKMSFQSVIRLSRIVTSSEKNSVNFSEKLFSDEKLTEEEKETVLEVFSSILLTKIHEYQKQIITAGPHSTLGKFYRETIKKYEQAIFFMIDKIMYLDDEPSLSEVISSVLKNYPHLLSYEIFEVILAIGETEADSELFSDKVKVGVATVFGENFFKINNQQ